MGITKNIAVQYGTQNIGANAICPYHVEITLLSATPPEIHRKWVESTPLKRLCTPE